MRLRKAIVAVMFFSALFLLASARPAEGAVSVSVSFFHQELSPYGRWVVAGSYGDVWVPSGVASGWAPYVDGEWIWTDYGYTWVSADPWGDTPFHYGSWVWSDPYGWVWVPGTVWAPAWVTWAYTDDYIGWAPLPPTFVLSYNGYAGGPIVVSQSRYCFVPTSRFIGAPVSSVRVPIAQNTTIFTRATKTTGFQVSGGIVHTAGPPAARVEKAIGRHLERASIDRLKARPTSLAAGGFSKGRSIHLATPASERSRELKMAGAHTNHEKMATTHGKTATTTTAHTAHTRATGQSTGKSHNAESAHRDSHVAGKSTGRTQTGHTSSMTESHVKSPKTTSTGHEKAHVDTKSEHVKTKSNEHRSSGGTGERHTTTSSSSGQVHHNDSHQTAHVAPQTHRVESSSGHEHVASPQGSGHPATAAAHAPQPAKNAQPHEKPKDKDKPEHQK